jgi:hypothetical protein
MRWSALAVATVCSIPSLAHSQTRVFVASNGNDLSPGCTIVAPCRNFSAAMAAVTDGGEVVVLNSAGYGQTTITKGVTITVPAGIFAGTRSTGTTFTVNAPGKLVRLDGLYFSGSGVSNGVGIRIEAANAVNISGSSFVGFADAGIVVTATSSANVLVESSVFSANAKGMRIENGRVMLQRNTFADNTIGVYASGDGGSNSYTPTGTTRVRITGCLVKNNTTALHMHDAGAQSVSGCNGYNIWLRLASNTYSHLDSIFLDNGKFVDISGTTTSTCSDPSQYDVGRTIMLPL